MTIVLFDQEREEGARGGEEGWPGTFPAQPGVLSPPGMEDFQKQGCDEALRGVRGEFWIL